MHRGQAPIYARSQWWCLTPTAQARIDGCLTPMHALTLAEA